MIEVGANYVSGFIVAYLVYRFIVMPNPWLAGKPFTVTLIFTVVSVARSYIWRRFFNAELHLLVHKFVGRVL
jgi:hypothetical protein